MANVLSEEKKQQVLALGRLGWSLRQIQTATRIRRETASQYWLRNRFTIHQTHKHGSRLNQAEIAISLFPRQRLGHRRIADRSSLRTETRAWSHRMNRHRIPIQWNFTRKHARTTFGYRITRSRY